MMPQQRKLGDSGVSVSALTLGGFPMSDRRYGAVDDTEALQTIRAALELGIDSFDTAPGYGDGHAEEVLGMALQGKRDGVVITSKCGLIHGPSGTRRDGSRRSILAEIEGTLRRLRTDHVDVYLVHWPDPDTSFDETMLALDAIVTAGKARLVGLSNCTADIVKACQSTRLVDVVQVGYNLFDERMAEDLFPFCSSNGIGVMAYGALSFGLLTASVTSDTRFSSSDWRAAGILFGQPLLRGENLRHNVAVVEMLRDRVARPKGITLPQLAVAWVLREPSVSTALVGARTPAEVNENVGAASVVLSAADLQQISEIMTHARGRSSVFLPFAAANIVWE